MDIFSSMLAFFRDQLWTISIIGVLAASTAFLMGRRWLSSRPAAVVTPPPEEGQPR